MDSEHIKQLIEGLLKHMQVSVQSIDVSESDGRQRFSVVTPDSHILIGTKGAHLSALNHLIKKMVATKENAKKDPSASPLSSGEGEREKTFFVDVNGYQEAALESVKNVAKIMGDRARSFKTSVELDPMSSYERMVIHSFFQDAKDVKTESVGEGERRRVVIKYTGEGSSF
ncbi:MAG: Jag protein [Parcubacteria group bacterium GW2011_GWA2_49_9]|nr:MAG: Jag protein [Parcubacteria group bacterium GW2011_GWA2_49_9]